jgi:hypothetical protein
VTIIDLHIKLIQARNNIFGPPYTQEDIVLLRTRADVEGWPDVLDRIEKMKPKRRRRLWISYLLSGAVTIIPLAEGDPYEDDNPWEGMD